MNLATLSPPHFCNLAIELQLYQHLGSLADDLQAHALFLCNSWVDGSYRLEVDAHSIERYWTQR